MHSYIQPLAERLAANADAETAKWARSYMKDHFEFFGIKSPLRNALFKEFRAENGLPEFEDLAPIVMELYAQPERDFHYFAIELTAKFKKQWTLRTLPLFENMAVTKSWWDSVDYINSVCIRPFFKKFPVDKYEITQKWIDSGNMWLQRLSIICQLGLREKTDTTLLSRNILQLNTSNEFFIQKAIGWSLRELSKSMPDTVLAFVENNELKPLSRREALRLLKK